MEEDLNLERLEKRLITKALRKYAAYSYAFIANELGILERTLFKKIIYHGLQNVVQEKRKIKDKIAVEAKIFELENKMTQKYEK